MARRGDELNSETTEIPSDCAQHIGVSLAGAASAGTYLAQAQRPAKELAKLLVQGFGEADLFVTRFAQHEVFAAPRGHAMVAGLRDGFLRTNLHAGGAKDATTEIKCDRFAGRARDGLGRADGHASIAAVGALSGINFQRAAMAVRQGWGRPAGISHRFATAFQTMGNRIKNKHSILNKVTSRTRSKRD
jgi:hypothetical protein